MTRPSDALVGKLTEGTATDWAPAALYTLINGRKNNAVVELSEWHKKSVNLLNTQGIVLNIFEDNGVYAFPVKMSVQIMENFAEECNFPQDRQFTRQDLQEQHYTACIRNLDACPRNYNTYQSVIFSSII